MTPAPALDPAFEENTGIDATQDHPDELQTPGEDDPTAIYRRMYGERYERLPLTLVNALRETIKTFGTQDRYLRRVEVLRDRKNRFYEKGVQQVFETTGGGFVQGTPSGSVQCANGTVQLGEFIDCYDIFGPYTRIQQAVLTQSSPGIAFEPDSADRIEDKESADTAEAYWEIFQRNNDIKKLQTQVVRMFQLSGRAVSWTRTEADAQRYGLNESGEPKQVEVTEIFGTLEHKCPILAKSLAGCLYNIIYRDPDVREAKARYPGAGYDGKPFEEKIVANTKGIGEDEYERMARIGVLQGAKTLSAIGESLNHIATTADCWLRPAAFTGKQYEDSFTDGAEGDPNANKTIKAALTALYPQGTHACFVGDTYVGSWDESTDDALDIQLPYEGDGMFGRAIMDPIAVVQDFTNDAINAFRECANYGWPSTWVNADQEQYKAITKQVSAPYTFRQFELRQKDGKIADSVFREQELAIPETLNDFMQWLQGIFAQFQIATPPSLWGASQEHVDTAAGQHLAASEAMGQMGVFFGRIQRLFSRIAYQAALLAANNPDQKKSIVVPGAGGAQQYSLDKIDKTRFRAYPDEDSTFPESVMQKRATLDQLLTQAMSAPELGMMIFSTPRNLRTVLKYKGFPEIVIPQAEVADKTQFTIEQLLQQSPMPPDPMMVEESEVQHAAQSIADPMTPPLQPLPPTPSITPGPLDYHQWEFEYCQEWMSSQARRDQEAAGNFAGVMNVQLYAMAQQAMIPPPPMMAAPPAAAPKAGKPPASVPGKPAAPPPAPAAPVAPQLQ